MVASLRRSEERLGRISCRIERCEAASQSGRQPAVAPLRQQQARAERYLLLQRVHVQPQYQRASAHGTRHPSTSRWCTMRAWQALVGGGSSSRVTHRGAGRGAAAARCAQIG